MKLLKKLFISDKSFYKKVLTLALPIAMQSAIAIGVNMLDTIMVGKVGEVELSAASLANQFISIYHIFCMGIGMGASVLIARYWAMKEMPSLKKTIALMLRVTLVLALFFAIITAFFPKQIMESYTSKKAAQESVQEAGAEENDENGLAAADKASAGETTDGAEKDGDGKELTAEEKAAIEAENVRRIQEAGVDYLKFSVITFFFLGLSQVCTITLRNIGKVRYPLYVSIGAFFVNFTANYSLIFGKFGAPELGIRGAALATLIARVFEAVLICGYLLAVDKNIGFRVKDIFIKASSLVPEYIRISIPVLVSDAILAFGGNTVAMVIGRLGKEFIAANAVTSVTQQMSSVVIQGVCQAGAIVIGYTLGEGGENSKEKAQRQGYAFLGLGILLGVISAVFIWAVSGPIIHAYDLTPSTAKMAHQLMNSISFIILFQATNSIMTKGVLRGGGDTKMLMLADNVFLWVLSIPLGIAAGFWWKLNPFWVYACLKFDQIAKAVWCVFRLRSGKWIKKIKKA